MELDSSEPETTDKFRGILTTKDEMLSSLDSRFDQVYSNDTYLLSTQQACESDSEVLPMEQGHKPIQPDDDNQEDISETSGPCNSQLGYSESDSI